MGYILIADDDRDIAQLIADSLEDEGYKTQIVTRGEEVLAKVNLEKQEIELILLDIMMPGKSGLAVCMQIREQVKCPIVFVSAKSSNENKVIGLEIGADDYITKPFMVAELVARVHAHLRRERRMYPGKNDKIELGDNIIIYKENGTVIKNEVYINLSTREFQVLSYLIEHMGQVVSRTQIFESVWGDHYGDMNSVTMHIKSIRDKLDPENRFIKTVWGVGYKLVKEEEKCL